MRCMGSKKRIASKIVPVIQDFINDDTVAYIQPFVGGANIIDHVRCSNRIGYDNNKYIIACLDALKNGWIPPQYVSQQEYKQIKNNMDRYPDYLVGYVGVSLSFGSKWFGGYKRGGYKNDGKNRDYCGQAYRSTIAQAKLLHGIDFITSDYKDIEIPNNSVIYCDPPYANTTGYMVKNFNNEQFYDWCYRMSKNNIVLLSQYQAPDCFVEIWRTDTFMNLNNNSNKDAQHRIQKLFLCENKEK